MKQLPTSLVPEFKVLVGQQFDVVAEPPASPSGSVFTLDALITDWRAGNAAKRIVIGLGSGREATDIQFSVTDDPGRRWSKAKTLFVRTSIPSLQARPERSRIQSRRRSPIGSRTPKSSRPVA